MNAYEHATVEDAAIQFAKAVPHASRQPVADPSTKAYFKGPTADDILTERGYTMGRYGSPECEKWHELFREVTRIGNLKAKGKYQMTPRMTKRARRMRDGGMSLESIGAVLGYSHTTIMRNVA